SYRDITTKNIFSPPRQTGPTDQNPDPNADLIAEVKYVLVTSIWYSDYYGGCWVACIHNRGNKGDTALLIDAPLPKKSPYLTQKKDRESKGRTVIIPRRAP